MSITHEIVGSSPTANTKPEIKRNRMRKIRYYYDPILKSNDGRYSVDFYCTDSKVSIWSGRLNGDTYADVLIQVKDLLNSLNKPRPLFGQNGRIRQWLWWRKQIRNRKTSVV